MSGRTDHRSPHFSETDRIVLLEQDADKFDRKFDDIRDEIKEVRVVLNRLLWAVVGALISGFTMTIVTYITRT